MNMRFALVFLLCIGLTLSTYGQKKQFFDYNEGLSNSLINQVYQDHQGFIWVATENGLNRFDGVSFKAFQGDGGNKTKLKADFVTALFEDQEGVLWVGQINGLQIYSHEKETFEEIKVMYNGQRIHPYISDITQDENGNLWIATSRYGLMKIAKKSKLPQFDEEVNNRLCSYYLESIFYASDSVLWIGSDNDGLSAFDLKTSEIQTYSKNKIGRWHIPGDDITDLVEDEEGNIYVGSLKSGLFKLNASTKTYEVVQAANSEFTNLPVKSLLFDRKKQLWVGTDGKGLFRLNKKTNLLENMQPGNSIFDFSKSKVHSIVEDKNGNIWLGIFQKGLFLFPQAPEMFRNYGYRAFGENSIGSNSITAIRGNAQKIWIATDGDGIYELDKATQVVHPLQLVNRRGETEGTNVLSLYDTEDGFLWIGTYFNGLLKYNLKSEVAKSYKNNPADSNSLVNDKITSVAQYKNDELLLSTLGGGVCRLNPENETFSNGLDWSDSLNALIPKYVNVIFSASNDDIWIGTYDGLVHAAVNEQKFTLYTTENGFLPHNVVYAIKADWKGNIWVGTYGGLVKIDAERKHVTHYTTKDGLGSNVICGIEEDQYHALWVSTHNGLSRFEGGDTSIVTFHVSDGIQANEFSRNASFKTPAGEIYFGGINGVTQVLNEYVNYQPNVSEVMLTDFMLFNKPVFIGQTTGKYTVLNRSILQADTVQLLESDNVFSIRFTSRQPANPGRTSYEYKMVGFEDNWNRSTPMNQTATYTNLGFGTYQFKVRGVNRDQKSPPRVLTIIIHPPWYKREWAIAIWIMLILTFFAIILLFIVERIKHQEEQKINEKKMRFFINISHEIKTPLSLIIDPLEKLMQRKNNEETNRLYRIMDINANRIYRLVSQLLDVRKIDKGQLLVKFQLTRIVAFIREISKAYEVFAETKKITLDISGDDSIGVWIDPLNFEKVILNLLSNAFKYTPEEGKIAIEVRGIHKNAKSADFSHVQITVSDSGPGIKKGDHQKIFERFYQGSDNGQRQVSGTGIGLNLSRSLIELNKGTLHAENRHDSTGAKFVIELPLGNSHLRNEDIISEENYLPAPRQHYTLANNDAVSKGLGKEAVNSRFKVLIVEDEDQIRDYLFHELKGVYHAKACKNGKIAMELLPEFRPDLIISDIMMPVMDGIALCKKVKGNIHTSHIPVILLTALSKEEDKAEGIDTGADMYIVKPFNSMLLQKTIKNLLENRRKIQQQLVQQSAGVPLNEIKMESHDELLMQKVMTIIKENLSNNSLTVEMLADGVGISRVHMHRKLKELTNLSARDFIRSVRMKQAAYILTTKKLNVSEVAYAVGYDNLSHFSTSFKSYFGISPTEYVKNNQVDKAPTQN